MVSSASVALNGDYASKHLVFLVLSVLAFSVTFILPLSVWNKLYLVGWLGALAFALVVLLPWRWAYRKRRYSLVANQWLYLASFGSRKVRFNDISRWLSPSLRRTTQCRTRQDICTFGNDRL